MELKERINQIIEYYSLTPSKFADLIGVQRSNISHILAGRNKPSLDFVLKVLEQFPSIESDWLIRGVGEPNFEDLDISNESPDESNSLLSFNNSESYSETDFSSSNTDVSESPISSIPNRENTTASQSEATPINDQPKRVTNTIDKPSAIKKMKRIIVFYDDNSFEEFHRD